MDQSSEGVPISFRNFFFQSLRGESYAVQIWKIIDDSLQNLYQASHLCATTHKHATEDIGKAEDWAG